MLWFSLAFNWQIYTWDSWGPTNNSDQQERVNFGVTWNWWLMANPFYFSDSVAWFLSDGARYEFYTSVPPGGSGFNAAWIAPAKSKTLTPDSKDPPLPLLLSTNRDGKLRLWFALQFSDLTINGQPASGYTISGWPDGLIWSYAVATQLFVPPGLSSVAT